MTKLEQEILDIINCTICGKYIGKLKVFVKTDEPQCGDSCREEYNTVYELRLYLDREFTPVILSYEGTEDEFKEFIREEIRKRKMENTRFFKINLECVVPDDEELIDEWDDE